jgi:hypothetical protein
MHHFHWDMELKWQGWSSIHTAILFYKYVIMIQPPSESLLPWLFPRASEYSLASLFKASLIRLPQISLSKFIGFTSCCESDLSQPGHARHWFPGNRSSHSAANCANRSRKEVCLYAVFEGDWTDELCIDAPGKIEY